MANVFDTLQQRGLVAQATDADAIRRILGSEEVTFYIGIDATADSLHVGHFLQLVVMRHLQLAGHKPIVLLGGGTTLIGDPTGKSDMRRMMTREEIDYNAERFKQQMQKFIEFGEDKAIIVNNADWLLDLNYMEFLREVGVHFSVNKMLATEAFKARMERGLSFMELNYMLLQSYDFLHLFRTYNCKMQFGGNDQWANIISGVDLIRRKEEKEAYGLTFTLLTNREGKKMGKTEQGTVWLDPEKMSPYDFFQYWRNIDDGDVQNCMRLLTDIPLEEIAAVQENDGASINAAKERLAHELTQVVHSQEEADNARETARGLFGKGAADENIPTTTLSAAQVPGGQIAVLDLLVACGLTASKGEGRRLVEQGGLRLDDEKVEEIDAVVNAEALVRGVILRKGKKVYHKAVLQQ
ncbi:tyrosine--tRNA ligase [Ruminococcaceae bacterium OttesenSCG-928-O06]|nr:tyrosine--tRNA ligase [Ruminococcaceae bacterium OttesenSCG-928-O06]